MAGWALDDNGVQSVDILVDGIIVGRAFYGMSWEGVAARYPNFPDSALPGFGYLLDTSHYLNGLHTVQPQVRSRAGELVLLEPRVIEFTNSETTLLPFGAIDFPRPRPSCAAPATSTARRRAATALSMAGPWTPACCPTTPVSATCSSSSTAPWWPTSDLDCTFNSVTGGLTQCYGLLRQDIEKQYPSLKDSPHSGFRFVLDIGALVASPGPEFDPPYNQGATLLTVRAGDHANNARNIAEIPVTFSCDQNNSNENSFGDIDVPRNGLIYSGTMTTTGWALDWEGVKQVFILVDGNFVGTAVYGIPRPDVSDLTFYPSYPNVSAPGWQFSFDTHQFSNGEHSLDVVVLDTPGVNIFIGKRRFVIGQRPVASGPAGCGSGRVSPTPHRDPVGRFRLQRLPISCSRAMFFLPVLSFAPHVCDRSDRLLRHA